MTEIPAKPIIFSGPMVRGILEDRKTKTRRVMKPQPWKDGEFPQCPGISKFFQRGDEWWGVPSYIPEWDPSPDHLFRIKPRFKVGDFLWVRETWQQYRANSPEQEATVKASLERFQRGEVTDIVAEASKWPVFGEGERKVLYAADFGDWAYNVDSDLKPWRPSIFMPRWASRITLEVTEVRVEKLNDISENDARAEGVEPYDGMSSAGYKHCTAFRLLWDKLNGKRYPWESNCYVWVISFRRVN